MHSYGNVKLMSSYYFTNADQGPPSVGVSGGKNCQDNKNWVCEHRWAGIANMVQWRNLAGTSSLANWQTGNSNQIAFSRGSAAFIAMNRDANVWSATLYTSLPAGTYCNVVHDVNSDNIQTCTDKVVVDSTGHAVVKVPALYAVAIHMKAKVA